MRRRSIGSRRRAATSRRVLQWAVSVVLLIICLVFVYDLLWWRAGDRMLRPLPRRRPWRVALGVFMAVQVLCLLWIVLGRMVLRTSDAAIPTWLLIATFVWHLLVLPVTVVVWLLIATGRGIGAVFRKVLWRKPAPPEQPAEALQRPSPR